VTNGLMPEVEVKELEKHYRVPEAAEVTGIGRSKLYELIKNGQLRSTKVGGMRLVPASALAELLAAGEGR
jgi:excisionase family DNA binding protein